MDGLKRATQNGERIYEYRMYQLFSIHEDCKYIYNDFIFLDKVTTKTLGIRTTGWGMHVYIEINQGISRHRQR